MKTLIVVDMQNDFITGSLGTKEAQAIVPNVIKKIEKYYSCRDNVIFTRDTHHPDYLDTQEGKILPVEHCIKNTLGWMVSEKIVNKLSDLGIIPNIINKESFGYNHWENMEYMLGNSTEIELIGLCTDICVVSNAIILKAYFPEIPITVDSSCCAGVTPELHEAALKVMKSCQIKVAGADKND